MCLIDGAVLPSPDHRRITQQQVVARSPAAPTVRPLFEDLGKGKGVRYTGLFECACWEEIEGIDKDKKLRKIILFSLIPVSTSAIDNLDDAVTQVPKINLRSIEDLRNAAYAASTIETTSTKGLTRKG